MTWKPRLVDPSEQRAISDIASTAFGLAPQVADDLYTQIELGREIDRTFVVDDGSTLAGTAGAYSFQLATPGGTLPMAGVTWVSVLPTYRRRGILTTLMDAVIAQAIEREEPLAGLEASEGGIYRRFGFGVASRCQTLLVDTAQVTELSSPGAPGRVRMLDEDEARTVLPTVWASHWRRTPGEVSRTPGLWEARAVDPESERDGATPRFLVVHETPDGEPEGYAIYRFKEGGAPGGEYNQLRVDEIAGADYAVEATLVRFLMEVDLARQLRWHASVDLPLPWQLSDPRALKVEGQHDMLWLKLLDVPTCLGGRAYAAEGGAVIEVVDDAHPELGGRFILDAGPDGADCTTTSADADVVVRMPDLGSLYLGGVSWYTLALAGLVEEVTPGAVDRLDVLFRPRRAPYCVTDF